MMDETIATATNQLRHLDQELETILTSFDTSYAWNYGNVKEGLGPLREGEARSVERDDPAPLEHGRRPRARHHPRRHQPARRLPAVRAPHGEGEEPPPPRPGGAPALAVPPRR